MDRLVVAALAAFGLYLAVLESVQAEITAEQVREAIDNGNAYILSQQRNDGSWPETNYNRGGISALCTLALLNAGVQVDDARIQNALDFLRRIESSKTYVVALQTMVFARAEPEKDRLLIGRNVRWLEKTQIITGSNTGAWSYPYPWSSDEIHNEGGVPMIGDKSNSQFALLALYEAERNGVMANEQTWRLAKKYWEQSQYKDGSWSYSNTKHGWSTGSMTCAGIASLVIAADKVQPTDARAIGGHIECCIAREPGENDHIERAFQWLGQNYSIAHNPGAKNTWNLYYLYGLERAGRLTAQRFIPLPSKPGTPSRADWYREGADYLVHTEDALSGFWTSPPSEKNPLIGTSFALLFLSKGRWPVLLGKLQFCDGDNWNRHRSDVGNLTRYVETRWKRDLTWQVIDLHLASVDDLIQTPVLHLCGSQSPMPKDPTQRKELAQKLRDYLDRGGFIMAEADCGSQAFDSGFRQLMADVFPEPEYKLRLLDLEHPIWYAEEKIDAKQVRPIFGIEFGCRTSVVYAPPEELRPSLSSLWELSRPGRDVKYSPVVQAQVDAGMSLGINVLAYATNRELHTKESFFRPTTPRPQNDNSAERGRIEVANLRHPGGCDATPRALANLMEAASDELKIRAHVLSESIDITDPALFDYHLVFMHGRTAFHLTDYERRQLKQYIERGGMLFADSICASKTFSESFRREMSAIFSGSKLERIPVGDSLLSTAYGGFDLRTVSRLDPEGSGHGKTLDAAINKVAPDLEGIKFGDRWGVVFSQYDLSCALEKKNSLDCRGYMREDAARIGLNVVLYSLQQ